MVKGWWTYPRSSYDPDEVLSLATADSVYPLVMLCFNERRYLDVPVRIDVFVPRVQGYAAFNAHGGWKEVGR